MKTNWWRSELELDSKLAAIAVGCALALAVFYVLWSNAWLPPEDGADGLGLRILADPLVNGVMWRFALVVVAPLAFLLGRICLARCCIARAALIVNGAVGLAILVATPFHMRAAIGAALYALVLAMCACWLLRTSAFLRRTD